MTFEECYRTALAIIDEGLPENRSVCLGVDAWRYNHDPRETVTWKVSIHPGNGTPCDILYASTPQLLIDKLRVYILSQTEQDEVAEVGEIAPREDAQCVVCGRRSV